MKATIERFLYNRAGFKAYRYNNHSHSSYIVDLVGPPGIGKTTLIKALIERSLIQAENDSFDKKERVCKSRARLLSLAALNQGDIATLQRKAVKLIYDLNISQSRKGYVVDEGLSHHFANELCSMFLESPDDFKLLMQRRAVINLTASPETICSRIRIRGNKTGRLLPCHQDKSDEELVIFNTEALRGREYLATCMKEAGYPILTVNMEGARELAVDHIEVFFSSLAQR